MPLRLAALPMRMSAKRSVLASWLNAKRAPVRRRAALRARVRLRLAACRDKACGPRANPNKCARDQEVY